MTNAWTPVGSTKAKHLRDARLELHWAAQILLATADAYLDTKDDDSHTSMLWSQNRRAMLGQKLPFGAQLGLGLAEQKLFICASSGGNLADTALDIELSGKTLTDLLDWTQTVLRKTFGASNKELALRDYDMPSHPVSTAAAQFGTMEATAATELAKYYDNGNSALLRFAESQNISAQIAIWPHHFDIGGIHFLDPNTPSAQARQIGFGMSPGDKYYEEPYFYVTPWPIANMADLSTLEGDGHWHTLDFTGAILLASNIHSDSSIQQYQVDTFLASAIAASRRLIPEK